MYFRCSENWANKKKAAALEVGRFPPLKLQRRNESGVWTVTRQIIVKIEQKFSIKKKNTLTTQFPQIVMIDFRATLPSGSKDKNQFVCFCDNIELIYCLKITSGVATCDTDAHGRVVIIEPHKGTVAHRHGCSHVKLTCVYIFHNNAFLNLNTSGLGFQYRFFAK